MEIKTGFRWLILTSLAALMFAGCRGPGNGEKPTEAQHPLTEAGAPTEESRPPTEALRPTTTDEGQPTPHKTLTPSPAEARATPFAMEPAAGICSGPFEGDLAPVEIRPDAPSPRCLKITANQQLQVTNQTETLVNLRLGSLEVQLAAGEAITLEATLGSLLAPGVHVLGAAPFGGPELWLQE